MEESFYYCKVKLKNGDIIEDKFTISRNLLNISYNNRNISLKLDHIRISSTLYSRGFDIAFKYKFEIDDIDISEIIPYDQNKQLLGDLREDLQKFENFNEKLLYRDRSYFPIAYFMVVMNLVIYVIFNSEFLSNYNFLELIRINYGFLIVLVFYDYSLLKILFWHKGNKLNINRNKNSFENELSLINLKIPGFLFAFCQIYLFVISVILKLNISYYVIFFIIPLFLLIITFKNFNIGFKLS